jgi:hypothetical protein
MRETKEQFIDRTIEVWQPRTSKVLTREVARQIVENVTGLFSILMEWEVAEQHTDNKINRSKLEADCHSTERPFE